VLFALGGEAEDEGLDDDVDDDDDDDRWEGIGLGFVSIEMLSEEFPAVARQYTERE
jgi:hypothetical protein